MAVYVDVLRHHPTPIGRRFGRSCHLYAETLDELHAVARLIGLPARAFQHGRFPHYDLDDSLRSAAIAWGAVVHTRRQAVLFCRSMGWTRRTALVDPAAIA